MSDDAEAHSHQNIQHNGETYIKLSDAAATFRHLRSEITRLRAELATARRDVLAEIKQDTDELIEQGRQDGMEEAAQIAAATAHANRVEYPKKWRDRPQGIPHDWSVAWETCAETAEEIAAAIRAAAGEVK